MDAAAPSVPTRPTLDRSLVIRNLRKEYRAGDAGAATTCR